MGDSIYDVYTEGEGVNKSTNFSDFVDKEERAGQKIPKSCGRHMWKPPCEMPQPLTSLYLMHVSWPFVFAEFFTWNKQGVISAQLSAFLAFIALAMWRGHFRALLPQGRHLCKNKQQ